MTTPRMLMTGAAVALLALVACGTDDAVPPASVDGGGPTAPAISAGATVAVENIAFRPAELNVLRGTQVTWINRDAGVAHTVTSGVGGSNAVAGVSDGTPSRADGTFDGDLPAAATFSFTFNESGTFAYFCAIHPSMRATVVVD